MKNKKPSFTLIEMSISILVIGILTTGVMVGRTIIDKAKIQSISSDLMQLKKNYQLFKSTYGLVPGKLTYQQCTLEPTFQSSGICGSSEITTDTITSGQNFATITSSTSAVSLTNQSYPGTKGTNIIQTWTESMAASLYMSLAKMNDVIYSNPTYDAGNFSGSKYRQNAFPKLNSNSGVALVLYGFSSNSTTIFDFYMVGGINNFYNFLGKNFIITLDATGQTSINHFSPNTMKALDLKIDNGSPYSGDLIVANGADFISSSTPLSGPSNCTTGASFSSSTYNNSDKFLCRLAFLVD